MKNPDQHPLDHTDTKLIGMPIVSKGDIAANLWLAAEQIERHGHCKGKLTSDGRTCAFGALSRTSTAPGSVVAAAAAVEKMLETQLVAWNDAPERTPEEVIAIFRRASALMSAV